VFSGTKSYTSTLVGIAEGEGALDVDDRASTYIPEWVGTPSEGVTIRDLLSNDSGRHWDAVTDYQGLTTASDRTALAIALPQDADPGTTWAYNNAAIQTLDAVLAQATGTSPAAYAEERLFEPIGMQHSHLSVDGAGNTSMFSGLRSTCEDMARFGYLFLHEGSWDGTPIVPAEWVEAATGQPSQTLNAAYGYLWWLNRPGPIAADPLRPVTADEAAVAPHGHLVPGAPERMYWALGFGGQVVQVDPDSGTVVVRLGPRGDLGATTGPGNVGRYGPDDTARVVTEALLGPNV
jgi:CubicO group peptidase (beta-lactamase class C family)